MAVVNAVAARKMVALAEERIGSVGTWWLEDSGGLKRWFEAYGIAVGECLAVDSGTGVVVWLMPFGDGSNCDCRGIGGGTIGEKRGAQGLHKEMEGKAFVSWFDPMRAAAKAAKGPAAPLRLASRLCVRMTGTKTWCLARVASLEPLMVLLEKGGSPIAAASFSDKWFECFNRTVAFEELWESGKTAFSAYIAMLGALAKAHKRVAPAEYAETKAKLTKK